MSVSALRISSQVTQVRHVYVIPRQASSLHCGTHILRHRIWSILLEKHEIHVINELMHA